MAAIASEKKQPGRKFTFETAADLVKHFALPSSRIRLHPVPGKARERDALALAEATDKLLCELIDGTLVQKAFGARESLLAAYLIEVLAPFVRAHNLGLVLGEAGMIRLARGQIRIPDVTFISWDSLPEGRVPRKAVPKLTPDLVVEVLSKGNTGREMDRKRRDDFHAGGKLFWEVNPRKRVVCVFTAPRELTTLSETDVLDGGTVLPGFRLKLRDLFGQLDRHA